MKAACLVVGMFVLLQVPSLEARDFMKSTLAGPGRLFFLPSVDPKHGVRPVQEKAKERRFACRTLGKAGMELPIINMGFMNADCHEHGGSAQVGPPGSERSHRCPGIHHA